MKEALGDPSTRKELLAKAEQNMKDPSYRDKARCGRTLSGLRLGAALGIVAGVMAANAIGDIATEAYQRLQETGTLTDYDRINLTAGVANSGAPGSEYIALQLNRLLQTATQ